MHFLYNITLLFYLSLFIFSSFPPYENVSGEKEVIIIRDIEYIDKNNSDYDSLQKLNLLLSSEKRSPLLVWIGGGAWAHVNPNIEMDFCEKVASEGISVASVGHRLSAIEWAKPIRKTGVQHPEHVKDIAYAFKWLYENADKYGYDKNNIFIGGFSSGAHLSALIGSDTIYLSNVGMKTSQITALIPVSGAYDINDYYQSFIRDDQEYLAEKHVKVVFGEGEKQFTNASPSNFLDQLNVPMLLISERDTYTYTKLYEDALKKSGFSDLEVIHISEFGHSELWKNISYEAKSKTREQIIDYIRRKSN